MANEKSKTEVRDKLISLRADPSNMLRYTVNRFTDGLDNIDIRGVGNPFMMSQESTAQCASAIMTHGESIMRRIYPKLAITEEELYPHLTDKTLVERFAQPSTCNEFVFIFDLDELKAKGVTDPLSGTTKLVIPESTILSNGVVEYGLYYNLEIIILKNGGIKTTWQGNLDTGLKALSTNVVSHDVYRDITTGGNKLRLFFPGDQYSLNVTYLNLNVSGGNKTKIILKDQYYTCVVWNTNAVTGEVEKVYTTLSDQWFDTTKLTVVLQVADGILTVSLPAIYNSNNTLGPKLRIDVYTTKGDYYHAMAEDSTDMFSWSFRDINGTYSKYVAPLATLSNITFGSIAEVSGGRNALSTDALREQVIYANNSKTVPITPRDQTITLADYGLTITPIKDQVTDLMYLTSKPVSTPTEIPTSISPIGIFNSMITLNSSELSALETVSTNVDRLTLKPETLYKEHNGVVTVVSDSARASLDGLTDSDLVMALKSNNYVYSPYHYVLDNTGNYFSLGCYYLDAPSLTGRQYLEDNDTVPYILAPKQYSFTKVDTGYKLDIVITKDKGLSGFNQNDVFIQLGFIPNLSNGMVYLNGEFIGVTGTEQNYVYRFMLDTDYVIDRNDSIHLTTFKVDEDDVVSYPCPLDHDFQVYIGVYDWLPSLSNIGAKQTTMDTEVQSRLLEDREYLVLSHEKVRLRFGDALNRLYKPTRSVPAEIQYKKYAEDVLGWYEKSVLLIDPDTDLPAIDLSSPEDPFTVLHQKGDPVLDSNGEQQVLYPKGATMYDSDNNPIPISEGEVIQQATLMFMDAKYRYSTDAEVIAYRDSIPLEIVSVLENDISKIQSQLLGLSKLFLAPKNNMGYIRVYDGAFTKSIPARQEANIELWVSKDNYANTALRASIEASCKEIYITALESSQVSVGAIQKQIQDTLKGDIIGCLVKGLGATNDLQTVSVVDNNSTLALATEMSIRSDGKLIIKDAINFKWVRFDMNN